jgi:hypothetical protein
MKAYVLFLAFAFALPSVSADVTTSNAYFAGGSVAKETVFLHDMDYINSAQISTANIWNAHSQGSSVDGSEEGRFIDDISIGPQGSCIDASAKKLGFSRDLSVGIYNWEQVSYSIESGSSRAHYSVPGTYVIEEISANNNKFEGSYGTTESDLFSEGAGRSTVDAPSSFTHNILLTHLGMQCNLKSYLNSEGAGGGWRPASYYWSGYAFTASRRNLAIAGIDITGNQGNRRLEFEIKGQSQPPLPKYPDGPTAPEKNPPAVIEPQTDPSQITITAIYMQYLITESAVTLGDKSEPIPPEN